MSPKAGCRKVTFAAAVVSFMKPALALILFPALSWAQDCHYQTWSWSVRERRPVDVRQVVTSKAKLTPEERGTHEGCTVCEEDQTTLTIAGLSFKICRRYTHRVEQTLSGLHRRGFSLKELEGYRVGKSKGPVNAQGLRTQFSHHSYGVALDINASLNGLYENCARFSPGCRLLRGGVYDPKAPGAISPAIAELFKSQGFKWGGELPGQQKDFMHFSPTGD